MRLRATPTALGALFTIVFSLPLSATDPPHDSTFSIECVNCHTPHSAPGGTLSSTDGNANLCQSCHRPGGPGQPMNDADQALPAPGLPGGTPASGDMHRWDSGASGHGEPDSGNTSTGSVISGGVFSGRFAKTYTLTITGAGDAGSATFSWTGTQGGSAGGLTTGSSVPLDEGVDVSFADGATSPSFQAGDSWRVFVRTDLNHPTDPELSLRLEDGKVMCSTCHSQHSQEHTPFTPYGPAPAPWGGPGTGAGRFFLRADNDADQMCKDCHSSRDVNASALGSHPVGPDTTAACESCHDDDLLHTPDPLLTPVGFDMTIECTSCHQVHDAPTSDGSLTRAANHNTLCTNCHQLADLAAGTHFDAAGGVLWPGGQYGSSFPEITDTGRRGYCTNCHQPHGWPDSGNIAQDYPTLLVESSSNLCITCHDGSPASDQLVDFSSTLFVTGTVGDANNLNLNTRHDVKDSDQAVSGTDLACGDCHDPHTATPTATLRPDPDTTDGRVPTAGFSWSGSSLESEWCLDCHDGSFPSGVTGPTTALVDLRDKYLNSDRHGVANGNARLKAGYGWADNEIVPCTACHVAEHGSTNLFQLRTTIYSKDGLTAIPSDCGGTTVELTDNNNGDITINGWCFCNTCHDNSMGDNNRDNCFESGCHTHGDRL